MWMPKGLCALTFAISLASAAPLAAEEVVSEVEFDGVVLSIVETDDGEQSIRMGEIELARNFFAGFDREVEVEGLPVALFYVGDGGNACGASTLIVWRNADNGEIERYLHDEGCGSPLPAVSDNGLYFIPYLLPGEAATLKSWTPSAGLHITGSLEYQPNPDTDWNTLLRPPPLHPLDMMKNAAVYALVSDMLGDAESLALFAKGLSVSSEPRMQDGLLHASGCIPHNCGDGDSLLIADTKAQSVYIAQKRDGEYKTWPEQNAWPDTATALLNAYRLD